MEKDRKVFSRRAIVAVFLCSFVAQLYQVHQAVLAYMYMGFSWINPNIVILTLTLPALLAIGFNFVLGPIVSKKFDRKLLMLIGMFGYLIEAILILGSGGKNFGFVLFACSLGGFSFAILGTVTDIIFSEYDPSGTMFGWNRGLTGVGLMVSMAIAGHLAQGGVWQNVFWVFLLIIPVFLFVVVCLPTIKVKSMAEYRKENFAAELGQEAVGAGGVSLLMEILIGLLLFQFAVMMYVFNFSSYIITEFKLGTSVQSGYVGSLMSAGNILAGLVIAVVLKRLKTKTMGVTALIYLALNLSLIFIQNINVMYITSPFFGMSILLCVGTGTTWACNYTIKNTATAIASVSIMQGIALVTAEYIANFVAYLSGGGMMAKLWFGAICIVISSIILFHVGGRIKKIQNDTTGLRVLHEKVQ
jgi:MFS family permease